MSGNEFNDMTSENEIIEELRKIREAITPKPTPPEPKPAIFCAVSCNFD